jgi:NAD-specific glutamate dehydrogenase
MATINIVHRPFCPQWNYIIKPRPLPPEKVWSYFLTLTKWLSRNNFTLLGYSKFVVPGSGGSESEQERGLSMSMSKMPIIR